MLTHAHRHGGDDAPRAWRRRRRDADGLRHGERARRGRVGAPASDFRALVGDGVRHRGEGGGYHTRGLEWAVDLAGASLVCGGGLLHRDLGCGSLVFACGLWMYMDRHHRVLDGAWVLIT
jgi:hypothetical protein